MKVTGAKKKAAPFKKYRKFWIRLRSYFRWNSWPGFLLSEICREKEQRTRRALPHRQILSGCEACLCAKKRNNLWAFFNLLPISLPTMAQKTFSTLGSLTTPLTLLSIGASFEDAKAIKFGFRGQELIALLIMLGSPTTPASYVMSKNMGHDGTLSASCVAATTLFSAITMTFWIYVLSAGGFLT